MTSLPIKLLVTFCLFVFVSGCAHTVPLHNVHQSPITNKELTLDQISQRIQKAGKDQGWSMEEKTPGKISGVLNRRTHVAEVVVSYSKESFDIDYAGSSQLKYDGQTIHKSYNQWVLDLERAIHDGMK
ncbi:MAG: hypothetical protein HQL87_03115 [Magnetococcales bacterium]|nr:hypothetical protein [Magnetococcales bacterium]